MDFAKTKKKNGTTKNGKGPGDENRTVPGTHLETKKISTRLARKRAGGGGGGGGVGEKLTPR